MKAIDRLSVLYNSRVVGTLSLTPDNKLCVFQYAKSWFADGFSISPLELPLRPEIFIAKPDPFAGNFGVFEDSLPDGYGRYLLHKTLLKNGVDDTRLSAIDRLSIIGSGGMGALTYYPTNPIERPNEALDFDQLQERALNVLGEKCDDDASLLLFNSMNSGGCRPKALFSDDDGHWLIKFRHTYDPIDMGAEEFRYNEVARRCGINVPDFKLTNGRYFTSKRFDIAADGTRIHTLTAGGLMSVALSTPILDYRNLMALVAFLTHNKNDLEEMYRRMVFNYLVDNKDDHCKNFSFCVDDRTGEPTWYLAPAYDLTLCSEGYNGEHATSVNFLNRPRVQDFIEVGLRARISRERCVELYEQVRDNCGEILCYDPKL